MRWPVEECIAHKHAHLYIIKMKNIFVIGVGSILWASYSVYNSEIKGKVVKIKRPLIGFKVFKCVFTHQIYRKKR